MPGAFRSFWQALPLMSLSNATHGERHWITQQADRLLKAFALQSPGALTCAGELVHWADGAKSLKQASPSGQIWWLFNQPTALNNVRVFVHERSILKGPTLLFVLVPVSSESPFRSKTVSRFHTHTQKWERKLYPPLL